MRWAEGNVDKILTLRNLACNDRWDEGWAQVEAEQQAASRRKRAARNGEHAMRGKAALVPASVVAGGDARPPVAALHGFPTPVLGKLTAPAPNHPYRLSGTVI
ncbi:MAG: hypothetical protein NVS2B7_21420 [Herpetosiphon sp.]